MRNSCLADSIVDITWTRGPNLPRPVKGQAQGLLGDLIVYACGFAFDATDYQRPSSTATREEVNQIRWSRRLRYCRETWAFNPHRSEFSRLPDAPVGAFWPEGIGLGADFYLLTGAMRNAENAGFNDEWQPGEKRDLTSPRIFCLRRQQDSWGWDEFPPMRTGRFLPGLALVGTTLYVIGGQACFGGAPFSGDRAGPHVSAVESIDLTEPQRGWNDVAPLPGLARECPTTATAEGKLYVFGGFYDHIYHDPDRQSWHCGDAYCYDPRTCRWDQLPDLPFGIQGAPAVTVSNRYILIMAGIRGGNRVEHPFGGDRSGTPRANLEVILFDTQSQTYRLLPTRLPPAPADPWQPQNPWSDPSSTLRDYWCLPKVSLVGNDTVYLLGGEVLDLAYSNCTDAMWIGTIVFEKPEGHP